MLHFTDLVLLEVPKVRHVQVLIVRLGFTLAATSATAAEAATAEVTTRQQTADSKQGLKIASFVTLRQITRFNAQKQSMPMSLFISFHPWGDSNFIFRDDCKREQRGWPGCRGRAVWRPLMASR